MKKLLFIQSDDTLSTKVSKDFSPFLLMDYMGPMDLKQKKKNLQKEEHVLSGLELVTIVYSSDIEKRNLEDDMKVLTKGDIKWMSGDSGLIHKDNNSLTLDAQEIVQLWINLPNKGPIHPRSQEIKADQIPLIQLQDNAGKIRVLAGEYQGLLGPTETLSPMNLWDMRLNAGHTIEFKVPEGHTAALFVLSGGIILSDGNEVNEAELGILERQGDTFSLTTKEHTKILFLGGEPVNEPVIGFAPFEMQSPEEILSKLKKYSSIDVIVKV
ncbi:pirin-like C-terminal cupin domain-containing protein [Bacteriovorax sp. PP10]|uniref:Pirin-like C-terminal cupin domain-containing protein n=1 Tax=Bacteriovorax antarcticus TaxID=3088717 RepID=A0ABU5VZG8_9BACT|nr:pirin-like C-terminal cupin domain-containing protein [Bacteriovorax sp. PP10]MEA9358396.1 pirin-like C-terminal cupin domain-containing protein [Bacteriovorax sp. PP10]